VFRKLGRRFRNLLTRDYDLEEQLTQARQAGQPFSMPVEALFDLFEPSTGALEDAKAAALASNWKEAGQGVLDHFHDRLRPQGFVHHSDLESLVAAFRNHPQECRRWVKTAELAVQHRFAPMQGEEYAFPQAIDWYSDFCGGSWMQAPADRLRLHFTANPLSPPAQEGLLRSWSFNEHGHLLDLARSYWLTGNETYASEAIVQAVDWSERNPVGIGINWYHPRSAAVRGLHWLLMLEHLSLSNLMTGELLCRLLRTVVVHMGHLALHLRDGEAGGTRLICAAGLYLLSSHLPELAPAKKWQALARQHLSIAVAQDFENDGMHSSGNVSLHREALDWLLLCYLLDLMNSRSPELLHQACVSGLEALLYLKPPPGQQGESGAALTEGLLGRYGGPNEHSHRLLTLGALLLQRDDLNPGGEASPELFWWLGAEGLSRLQQLDKSEPRGIRRLFAPAQVAVVRDNWGPRASWCQLKGATGRWKREEQGRYCNPEPIALPQHDDALSLCVSLDGEPLFVEPGVPMVGGEASRVFSRLNSHSAPRIGRELEPLQVAPDPPESPARLQLESCRDGHYMCAQRPVWFDLDQPYWLTREVLFLPKKQRVIIRDTLDGEGEVHFESNLLLSPHLDILMRGDMGSLLRGRKLQARILPLFPTRFRYEVIKGKTHEMQGFLWSDAGRAVPTSLLRYYARVPVPATVSLWIAWNPEDTLSPRPQDVEKLFKGR
jgi:hypothetical protein